MIQVPLLLNGISFKSIIYFYMFLYIFIQHLMSTYKKAAVSGTGVPDENKRKVHSLYIESENEISKHNPE